MKWISPEEELPNDGEFVLIYVPNKNTGDMIYYDCILKYEGENFCIKNVDRLYSFRDIKCWARIDLPDF